MPHFVSRGDHSARASLEAAPRMRRISRNVRLFLGVLMVVFISETTVMFILDRIKMQDKSLEAFVDSTMLTCFSTPFLWFWIVKSQNDRERVEVELRRSEARLRRLALIAERTDNAVILTDREGRVEWVNPGFRRLTGYSLNEVRGKKPGELLQGPKTDSATVDFMSRRLQKGQEFKVELINYSKQGREYWVAVEVQPIRNQQREITHFMAVELDITERKETERLMLHINEMLEQRVEERTAELAASEERFRLMVERVKDYAIFMLDAEGRVETWNAGAQRLKGYPAPEILGRHFATFFNQEGRDTGQPEELIYRAKFVGHAQDEFSCVREDGSSFWAEITINTIKQADGALRGFSVVSHDLTERKNTESQLLRSQRLESIGTLAGGIAHDLNNALAPILLGLEMLESEHPEQTELMETFQFCSKRATGMVRQLLSFAKGAEGQRVEIDPRHLVREMEKIIKATFPKGIRLQVRVAEERSNLKGDATQLHQVLLNLCVNARDAMEGQGELTLECECTMVDEAQARKLRRGMPGDYVVFRVRDTGSGIPPAIMERIFDPFFTTKGPELGTGLGLSTVSGIVENHGGFLHVDSVPGEGTVFSAYIPALSETGGIISLEKFAGGLGGPGRARAGRG